MKTALALALVLSALIPQEAAKKGPPCDLATVEDAVTAMREAGAIRPCCRHLARRRHGSDPQGLPVRAFAVELEGRASASDWTKAKCGC